MAMKVQIQLINFLRTILYNYQRLPTVFLQSIWVQHQATVTAMMLLIQLLKAQQLKMLQQFHPTTITSLGVHQVINCLWPIQLHKVVHQFIVLIMHHHHHIIHQDHYTVLIIIFHHPLFHIKVFLIHIAERALECHNHSIVGIN